LANTITLFLLEHPDHPGKLNSYDAQTLEILVLVNNPTIQATASRNWAYLSPQRRLCLDLVMRLQEMVKEKLPLPTSSAHPLLQQLESAETKLRKVFCLFLI